MDIVYAPLSQCKTRLRQQNHYGQDDPCLWPQPFSMDIGHLAVIPSPHLSETQPLYWAWYHPISTDFDPYPVAGLSGMVQLSTSLQDRVIEMCAAVSTSVSTLAEPQKSDSLLTRTRDQLRKYLERLGEPSSPNVVALQLACLQRIVLELYARVEWLKKWIPRFNDIDCFYEVDPTVMGAFTGDLDVASDLFRVGMPMWLIRPLQSMALTPINSPVAPLSESFDHRLPVRGSHTHFFDVSDCSPPHPTIYTGLAGHYKRYKRMVTYIKQQFSSGLVGEFQDELECTPGSSVPVPITPIDTGSSQARNQAHSATVLTRLDVTSHEWVSLPQAKKKAKQGMSYFHNLLSI